VYRFGPLRPVDHPSMQTPIPSSASHAAADRPPPLATDRGTNGRATLIYIDKNFVTCPPTHTHTVHMEMILPKDYTTNHQRQARQQRREKQQQQHTLLRQVYTHTHTHIVRWWWDSGAALQKFYPYSPILQKKIAIRDLFFPTASMLNPFFSLFIVSSFNRQ